jgi:hypothetical protein
MQAAAKVRISFSNVKKLTKRAIEQPTETTLVPTGAVI